MSATAAELAVDHTGAAETSAARRRAIPWSVVALAVPAVVGIVRLILAVRRPYDFWGDHAILESAVRRVAEETQTLGPYSRFGFHQPGPAYFEAQAPFYWLTGASPRGMFLGAITLNLGSALGSVLVIRRYFGEGIARWAAVVLGAYLLFLGPALVADPWQVYVLGLPFLLTMLLAAAATRSVAAAAGAAVGASYVVQTHLATTAGIAAVLVAAVVVTLTTRGRSQPASGRRRFTPVTLAAAVAVLALMWVPPLLEEATHSPGNITMLARFFTRSHPEFDQGIDHGLHTSVSQVTRQMTVLPGGRRSAEGPAGPLDASVTLAGLLTAGGVLIVGWRRRDGVLAALGAFPVVGAAAAVWSTTRIVGEVHPYLLLWTSTLLLPAWIGAGVVVAGWRRGSTGRQAASGRLALALALGLVAIFGSWSFLRSPSPPLSTSGDVAAAGGLVRGWLAEHRVGSARIRFSHHDSWPLVAGIINYLDDKNLAVTVDPNYVFLFGDQFEPNGRERATVTLTPLADAPPNPQSVNVGDAGGARIWAVPPAP